MSNSCFEPAADSIANPPPDSPADAFRRCLLSAAVLTGTPDGKTLFVNFQHPGENTSESSDPAWPTSQAPEAVGKLPITT